VRKKWKELSYERVVSKKSGVYRVTKVKKKLKGNKRAR
jgi:hypothetical protein